MQEFKEFEERQGRTDRLEQGSRFARRQLYPVLAGGSRERLRVSNSIARAYPNRPEQTDALGKHDTLDYSREPPC